MNNNRVQIHQRALRQSTTALNVPRTLRPHRNPLLLRLDPGFAVPIAAAGLLREDAVQRGRLAVSFVMDETAEALINPVFVKVTAYLVPWLAFERFTGRDLYEASYSKKALKPGDPVVPFIETMARGIEGAHPVLDALGRHSASTKQVSTMYVEAYNIIQNWRRKNVSLDLPERTRLDSTFDKAIRERGRMRHIVPSFDAAAMQGVVDVDVLGAGSVPVSGIGSVTTDTPYVSGGTFREPSGANTAFSHALDASGAGTHRVYFKSDASGRPQVFVDMDGAEMQFSLASIDRAKKMQLFAALRKRYNGLDDDDTIKKLMDGITMPDESMKQPIELGSRMAGFGFSTRFATDADNLDKTVVSGAAMLSMEFATPRIGVGGVLMFIAEVQPEQVFERQADPFLHITDVDEYPQFVRDDADEQKVDIVKNYEIDTAHSSPDGAFGYAPLHSRFRIESPCIGTGYFQPTPQTTFDEDRARIWISEAANPSLGQDWYLCSAIDKGVFQYTNRQPFEASGVLEMVISGNTVFGAELIDGSDDYEKLSEIVPGPEDQIDQ